MVSLLGRSGKVGRQFANRAAEEALDVAEHVNFVRSDDVEHHAVLDVTGRAGETVKQQGSEASAPKDVAGFQLPLLRAGAQSKDVPVHVIFDSARHVKVDEQGYLPYIAQTATERVVHDEDALRRLPVPARRSRAELGDDLLTRGLTHVLVQSQGFDAVAGAELVRDSLDRIDRSGVDNLRGGSSHGQLE